MCCPRKPQRESLLNEIASLLLFWGVRDCVKLVQKELSEGALSNSADDNDRIKHGAKKHTCREEGCTNQAQNGGVCFRHGAKRETCSNEGCTNHVVNGGVCRRHGAKKMTCRQEGCTNTAVKGGVCWHMVP